ncbi:MAG: hypothetical protein DSY88_03960 [Candidatus Poseidoniales archaeon]|nr:MAG: hypothetical protein DSY88_03960 [Candidatus Poseidoniales archaeon]
MCERTTEAWTGCGRRSSGKRVRWRTDDMASPGINPGMKAETQTLVCEHNVAGHVNKFSTPAMIQLMEQASSAVVNDALQEGEVSVGIEVNIRHLAAADIGATIIAHAELIEVDRNRLTFQVEAFDGDKKIGDGTHKRAIIKTGG